MSIEAMKQALEFIKATNKSSSFLLVPASQLNQTVNALSTAIAEAEKQEPVAWRWVPSKVWASYVLSDDPEKAALAREHGIEVEALCRCTTPPSAPQPAQRQPLTDEQRQSIVIVNKKYADSDEIDPYGVIDDVEAAHGIKENT